MENVLYCPDCGKKLKIAKCNIQHTPENIAISCPSGCMLFISSYSDVTFATKEYAEVIDLYKDVD